MIAAAYAKHLTATVDGVDFRPDTIGGNTFVDTMPSTPDLAVMVTAGPGRAQPTLDPSDLPSLQLIVRAPRGERRTGHDLAMAIYGELAGLDNVVLDPGGPDEVLVHGTTPAQSAPTSIGTDSSDRPEWSLNFDLDVHSPTTHRT